MNAFDFSRRAGAVFTIAVAAASVVLAGCATSGAKDTASDPYATAPWTAVPAASPSVPVAALPVGDHVVAAWIDADFSGRNVEFDVVPGSFVPDRSGVVSFRPASDAVRVASWAEMKAALATRDGEGPIGVIFTSAGKPAMEMNREPPRAMRNFLRLFRAGLADAGVDAVFLVPASFNVLQKTPQPALEQPQPAAEQPQPAAELQPATEPPPAKEVVTAPLQEAQTVVDAPVPNVVDTPHPRRNVSRSPWDF